jgi:hypothetical protein
MQDLQAHGTISKDSNTGLGLDGRSSMHQRLWYGNNEHVVSGTNFFVNQFIFFRQGAHADGRVQRSYYNILNILNHLSL